MNDSTFHASMSSKFPTALLLLLLAGLAGASTFLWWEQDDLYIHAQYARHVAEYGEWSFNRGEPSYGSTSPLWVLTLALPAALGVPIDWAAKGISAACYLVVLLMLCRWRAHFHHPMLHGVMLVAVLANHWLRLSTGSGMEATLAAVLVIAFADRLLKVEPATGKDHVVLGMLAGLATLCRPEFIYLPIALAVIPFTRISQLPLRLLCTACGMLLVLGPWFAYAHAVFGSIIPQTIHVKTTAHYLNEGNPWLDTLVRTVAFYTPAIGVEIIAVVLLALTALREKNAKLFFAVPPSVWLAALGIPAIYVLNQVRGSEGITYRYAAPALPLLIYIGFRCLDQWFHQDSEKRRSLVKPVAIALTAFTLIVQVGMSALHWPSLKKSHYYVHHVLWPAAEWLKENSDPDDVVACFDVGVIGYVSGRQVFDFIGLVSPDIFQYIQSAPSPLSHEDLIARFQPDYLFGTRPVSRAAKAWQIPVDCHEFDSFRFLPSTALGQRNSTRMIGCLYRLDLMETPGNKD